MSSCCIEQFPSSCLCLQAIHPPPASPPKPCDVHGLRTTPLHHTITLSAPGTPCNASPARPTRRAASTGPTRKAHRPRRRQRQCTPRTAHAGLPSPAHGPSTTPTSPKTLAAFLSPSRPQRQPNTPSKPITPVPTTNSSIAGLATASPTRHQAVGPAVPLAYFPDDGRTGQAAKIPTGSLHSPHGPVCGRSHHPATHLHGGPPTGITIPVRRGPWSSPPSDLRPCYDFPKGEHTLVGYGPRPPWNTTLDKPYPLTGHPSTMAGMTGFACSLFLCVSYPGISISLTDLFG